MSYLILKYLTNIVKIWVTVNKMSLLTLKYPTIMLKMWVKVNKMSLLTLNTQLTCSKCARKQIKCSNVTLLIFRQVWINYIIHFAELSARESLKRSNATRDIIPTWIILNLKPKFNWCHAFLSTCHFANLTKNKWVIMGWKLGLVTLMLEVRLG